MAAASKLGVEVVVGSDVRNPLEELGDGQMLGLDFANPIVGAGEIEQFSEQYPLDTIVAVDDGGALLAARAARRLELPYNSVALQQESLHRLIRLWRPRLIREMQRRH